MMKARECIYKESCSLCKAAQAGDGRASNNALQYYLYIYNTRYAVEIVTRLRSLGRSFGRATAPPDIRSIGSWAVQRRRTPSNATTWRGR